MSSDSVMININNSLIFIISSKNSIQRKINVLIQWNDIKLNKWDYEIKK